MKTYKVLESHLYERLMGILRGERHETPVLPEEEHNEEPAVAPTATSPSIDEALPISVQMEIESEQVTTQPALQLGHKSLAEEEKPTCTYVINYQVGDGINRAPQENWLSFHQFTQKRQQRENKKQKCRKKLGRH